MITLAMVALDNVARVYNGKSGCMCGCNGSYDTPESNPRRARMLMNRVLKNPAVAYCATSHSIYMDTETRSTVVYLTEATAAVAVAQEPL